MLSKCGSCAYRGLMCCLCRHLWLCSDEGQGCISFLTVVVPDLVQGHGWSEQGWSVCLADTGDLGIVLARIEAAGLPSEVWAISGVLFE